MKKDSALYQFMGIRLNDIKNGEYQAILRRSGEYSVRLKRVGLPFPLIDMHTVPIQHTFAVVIHSLSLQANFHGSPLNNFHLSAL